MTTYPAWSEGIAESADETLDVDQLLGLGAQRTVGDVVSRTTDPNGSAFVFRVKSTTGDARSGSVEPNWPQHPFVTITESTSTGSVTWESISPAYNELYSLQPSAIIELFELHLTTKLNGVDDVRYFHAGTNGLIVDITFNGQTYAATPITVDGFEKSTKGQLPRPKMVVSNVNNAMTALISLYNLEMAKVKRILTLKKFLDPVNFLGEDTFGTEGGFSLITEDNNSLNYDEHTTADSDFGKFPDEIYYVDRISAETKDAVEFELASNLDLINVKIPKRIISDYCPWKYREAGGDCTYTGTAFFDANDNPVSTAAEDVCGKKITSCRARFPDSTTIPYGGFHNVRIQT
jgi:phage-related protein